MDRKAVLARHDELKTLRQREEPEWRELARLFEPDNRDFAGNEDARGNFSEIFDATHLNAADNFEGGMFGQLVNPANRWFEVGVEGDPDLARWGPVKQHLWDRAKVIYGSMAPAVSSFYAEAPSWIGHTGVYGFGPFYQEETIGSGRIIDAALPVGEMYLDVDIDGLLTDVNREFRCSGSQYRRKFGAADRGGPIEDGRAYVVVHAVMENPDFQPGAFGPRGMAWKSFYVSPDRPDLWRVGGYYELPYHVPMWRRRAGRPYPTGPGHRTRPDVATLQEMERSHLVAAQFAAEPPTLLHEDSGLTAADIVPNALLHGGVNEAGKQLVQPMSRAQNLNLSHVQSEQRRQAIRDAFYFGVMQLINRPQMTATEFLGFQEETLRLLGPNLVRIQTGGLSPFIARRNNLLERAGRMPPAPRELAGRQLSIEYVSPLAKAMKLGEARQVLQWHSAVEQMAITDPEVRDYFDADGAAPVIHEALSGVPAAIRSAEAVAQRRKARAEQLARQQQLGEAEQMVKINAEAAHAEQASTLARTRGRR